ncbi:MAG: hypothetical protein ACREFP_20805 [Acetobacteraceae bacterium]
MVAALVGYGGFIARIKLKLIGSIVAISRICLLESFIYPARLQIRTTFRQIAFQAVIVICGLLPTVMDRLGGDEGKETHRSRFPSMTSSAGRPPLTSTARFPILGAPRGAPTGG